MREHTDAQESTGNTTHTHTHPVHSPTHTTHTCEGVGVAVSQREIDFSPLVPAPMLN